MSRMKWDGLTAATHHSLIRLMRVSTVEPRLWYFDATCEAIIQSYGRGQGAPAGYTDTVASHTA